MRDEDFQVFIDEFGEATHRVDVPKEAIEKWRGKLPDRLLDYWGTEGWSGYSNGLIWFVDPDDYEDLVDEWLDGSPLEQIDAFHVFARTGFGKLFLFGEATGQGVFINCATHSIFATERGLKKKNARELENSFRAFLGVSKDSCELDDDDGKPLFKRAIKTHGPLEPDEMYGFEPAIVLGGKMDLDHLHRVKLDQHLTILRQLAPPTMPMANIDFSKILPKS
ncbi:GAD-like domain-containing protein [Burkholderia thailandensis]|uniref:GAD-like domain-containing protein n=1 Tax=Burkholderia thailandensis TaxID=57975 RepID=UPI003B50F459